MVCVKVNVEMAQSVTITVKEIMSEVTSDKTTHEARV